MSYLLIELTLRVMPSCWPSPLQFVKDFDRTNCSIKSEESTSTEELDDEQNNDGEGVWSPDIEQSFHDSNFKDSHRTFLLNQHYQQLRHTTTNPETTSSYYNPPVSIFSPVTSSSFIESMSSNVTNMPNLQMISQNLSLTVGFIFLISGILGNILNIIIFITSGHYRHNASSYYIIARSFSDLTVIGFGLSTRLFSYNFRLDPTKISQFWCKFRVPLIYVASLTSLTFLCMQSINAYLSSSRSVIYRRMSNVRIARYLILSTLCIWILHEIPYVYYQQLINVVGTSSCISTNVSYSWYHNYFIQIGLWTIIPVTIIIVFAFLTYAHLHQRHALHDLTKQMIIMALAQSASVLIFQVPAGAAQTYFFVTANVNKSAYQYEIEQVIQLVFSSYGYGTYVVSCSVM
ncbi:hypothetical protein I4U23_026817 [Adineta vaga]|nr:hypothetical protein I4U23_026817 [Adineta vaga]